MKKYGNAIILNTLLETKRPNKNDHRGYAQPLPVDNLRITRESTRPQSAYTRLKRHNIFSQRRESELANPS